MEDFYYYFQDIVPDISFNIYTLVSLFLFKKIKEKYWYAKPSKNCDYFHKILFFPDDGLLRGCKNQCLDKSKRNNYANRNNSYDSSRNNSVSKSYIYHNSTSLIHLLNVLRNAKNELSICLLIMSCPEIQEEVTAAKKRGVNIRIIVDREMADVDGSCIPALQRENIAVLRGPPNMMIHHKFVLADACDDTRASLVNDSLEAGKTSGILATGSFNWTWSAVTCNYENIIITNNPDIVIPFVIEFERLWSILLNQIHFSKSDKAARNKNDVLSFRRNMV